MIPPDTRPDDMGFCGSDVPQDGRVGSAETGSHPTDQARSGLGASRFDPARGFLLKAYRVHVQGFAGSLYYAASRGKALRDAWRSYCSYRGVSFGDFLRIAHALREEPIGEQFGQPIKVGGRAAFFVTSNNQYVQFVRRGETEYFNAHPFDVEPEQFRPWTYRDRDGAEGGDANAAPVPQDRQARAGDGVGTADVIGGIAQDGAV